MRKWLSLGLVGVGLAVLLSVVLPIAYGQVKFWLEEKPKLIDPTATARDRRPVVTAVLGTTTTVDYSKPSNWFDLSGLPSAPTVSAKIGYYRLSLPKVGINDVSIEINGSDLKNGAAQFPGTAIPGTYGNTVIFGHSTLPSLYKSDNPLSVFNFLPQTKVGDEVVVNYDGVTYRYLVRETLEIHPDQIDILAQRYDKNEITLITCVPLGTYLRRFVVRAEMVN